MKKFSQFILFAFFFMALALVAVPAHAADFSSDEGISEQDLKASIVRNSSLSAAQVDSLIAILQKQLGVEAGQKIPIEGFLYTHGMNGAFFVDHDTWKFDATIRAPNSNELVDIPNLFICDFKNGGLKAELAYKWMFTFIPRGANVEDLDGGIYGRGIGVVFDAFFGVEASWMPAENRSHDMLHIAAKLGFGAGLVFPKMECKLRVKPVAPTTASNR